PSPVPTATNIAWGPANALPTLPQDDPSAAAASSENFVGCSSCHYGASTGNAPQYGNDPNDTAHRSAPYGNMANAQICGQCHSRYSYTVDTYTVAPVPYLKVDGAGSPIPNPTQTTLLQPQYAIGFKTLGEPTAWTAPDLSTLLNVPFPGWVPTPNPSATSVAGLQLYWKINGVDTPWVSSGHDGSAVQYVDWSGGADKHSNALKLLKDAVGPNPPAACLKCHSADYIISPDGAKPTGAQAKYGITCVGCHTPHDKGTAVGVWSNAFTPQLRTDSQKTLCVTCHNAEIPDGSTASPGATVHHPMKEMIDGYGAIDVASFPSVHKGKCVQCHMPPTTLSRGDKQLGANHTFKIIMPVVAAGVDPVTSGALTTTMPYSACTTCHSRPGDDAAVWLQDTIDQRQEWTKAKIVDIHAALDAAAVRLGYVDEAAAQTALVAIPAANRTASQTNFLKAFTNVGFVESEGSFGLHNWDYSRAIVNTALVEVNSVQTAPQVVTLKASKTSAPVNTTITYSGTVRPASAGTITIQRKASGGSWATWKTATVNSSGSYSLKVKMTNKRTSYFRAVFPAAVPFAGGTSNQIKVVIN
ncbi:MAG TPA: ammonia-forming cytochrome c nitrite reductase subunit c552, partial [Thermoleophilia bacterium]